MYIGGLPLSNSSKAGNELAGTSTRTRRSLLRVTSISSISASKVSNQRLISSQFIEFYLFSLYA